VSGRGGGGTTVVSSARALLGRSIVRARVKSERPKRERDFIPG
jgi:hypothetical protein